MATKIGNTQFGAIAGQDDFPNQGYGALGVARDDSQPPQDLTANRGFGVLGLVGKREDAKVVIDTLSAGLLGVRAGGQDPLNLSGPLPKAGAGGIANDPAEGSVGVLGYKNTGEPNGTMGFLAGTDPQFHQRAGVYGASRVQGVIGMTTASDGTGVYGGSVNGDGIGVRGETTTGAAGVQGRSFGSGLAGNFIGNVEVAGNVIVRGKVTITGELNANGSFSSLQQRIDALEQRAHILEQRVNMLEQRANIGI